MASKTQFSTQGLTLSKVLHQTIANLKKICKLKIDHAPALYQTHVLRYVLIGQYDNKFNNKWLINQHNINRSINNIKET